MRFKIDWASLIVESKFTVFALFYFVFKVAEHSFAAVSGNLHDGACFKLDKQTWRRKCNGTQKTISQNLLIKIL